MMKTTAKFVFLGLLLPALSAEAAENCNSNCSTSHNSSAPSLLHSVNEAVLHSKCYAMCTNEIIGTGNHLNCSVIQKIESCRIGCVLFNTGTKNCTQKCLAQSKDEEIIDWSTVYSAVQCIQHEDAESCTTGCSIVLADQVTSVNSNLNISNPDLAYIGSEDNLLYIINMTNIFNNSSYDLRVAMVIEIIDTNTSNVYYQWKPSLRAPIDLSFVACHEAILRVKIIYGNVSIPYSSAVKMCVKPLRNCNFKVLTANDYRIHLLENKLTKLLNLIHPFTTTTKTKRLDQIEAKVEEITNIINQQQSP